MPARKASTWTSALAAATGIALALGALAWAMQPDPPPVPGEGKPALLVDPDTGQRTPTTWDRVHRGEAHMDPVVGRWQFRPPGQKRWFYVINPEDPFNPKTLPPDTPRPTTATTRPQ